MANANTNSMAAVLSLIVRVIFWLSIIFGAFFFVIIGLGLFGSLNGGALNLPLVQALAQDVAPGRLVAVLVGIVVAASGIAYVCSQLRRILSTLAEGDPFVPENGPRLTRIAIAIALIEIVRTVATFVIAALVDVGEGSQATININLALWGAVIVLFVLAQVFREGTRLREEEKMTI
ncbi:MAG: DUF2975 domain-containing protein [Henriciella sp.]|nr:DUF2975 domain-containing protein [Henriciella sp.]